MQIAKHSLKYQAVNYGTCTSLKIIKPAIVIVLLSLVLLHNIILTDNIEATITTLTTSQSGPRSVTIKKLLGLNDVSTTLQMNCACDDSFSKAIQGNFGLPVHDSKLYTKPNDVNLMSNEYLTKTSQQLGIILQLANESGYLNWRRPEPPEQYSKPISAKYPYARHGFDPVCGTKDVFSSTSAWFRDNYISKNCNTQPRERALGFVLANLLKGYKQPGIVVHESSPNPFGSSLQYKKLFKDTKQNYTYVPSQFSFDVPCGGKVGEAISLNLENQSCISDNSFDVVITQDVFEHIYHPEKAFNEIKRTLKPGGFHIFTVPLTSKQYGTFEAARVDENLIVESGRNKLKVNLFAPPEIHGNPMGEGGSILTTQWGYDIVDLISASTDGEMNQNYLIYVESETMGIEYAEYREVIVSRKAGINNVFAKDVWQLLDTIVSSKPNTEVLFEKKMECTRKMIKCTQQ